MEAKRRGCSSTKALFGCSFQKTKKSKKNIQIMKKLDDFILKFPVFLDPNSKIFQIRSCVAKFIQTYKQKTN